LEIANTVTFGDNATQCRESSSHAGSLERLSSDAADTFSFLVLTASLTLEPSSATGTLGALGVP
jgi:hypothetical protein